MTQSRQSNFYISLLLAVLIVSTIMVSGCATLADPRVAGMKTEAEDFQQNNKELYKRIVKSYGSTRIHVG